MSPELAARPCDIKTLGLYGSRAKISFPLGSRDGPQPVAVDPRVVSRRKVRKNRLAFEQIETEHADEAYMADLRVNHPELVI